MRFFLILIAFSLLAFHEPGLVEANRYKAATKKVSNVKRARPALAVRQKARALAKTRKRTSAARPSRLSAAGKKLRAGLTLRSAVRGQTGKTKKALRAGDLTGAAAEIGRSPLRNAKGQFVKGPQKLSMRERFAVWRTTRSVKNAALKGAKVRSKLGSVEGTADALNALTVLEAKGKLGVYGRWQKARVTKRAFSNVRKSASSSMKAGDLEAAGRNFAFAAELRGGGRQTKSMAKELVKEGFKMAKAYSKAGDSQMTWDVLEMVANIAHEGGADFNTKLAQTLVNKSFTNALPELTKGAEKAFKAGEMSRAISMLAEARSIQRTGNAKVSRSVAKRQVRLVKRLGVRLHEFEAAQAAQQQQAEAAGAN
ncbi:MAG: hypothetical protein GY811_25355 [Myxococcales bacterium]|nr:hypothetical protein [Myxococcales bacterium]